MRKSPMQPSDDLDRLYQEMVAPGRWVVVRHTHAWRPPTDVYENDENVVIRVEVAGMKEADFNVTLTDRMLVITGIRRDPSPKVAYHQMEIHYGEFRTEVYLHWVVEADSIEAIYTDGFLQVTLPKSQRRTVHVTEAGGADAE